MVTSFNLGDHLAPGEKASEQTSVPTTLVYCCCFNPAVRFYNPCIYVEVLGLVYFLFETPLHTTDELTVFMTMRGHT